MKHSRAFVGGAIQARLRNGQGAILRKLKEPIHCFVFMGISGMDQWPHLWQSGGHWREDGTEHEFDVVAPEADFLETWMG